MDETISGTAKKGTTATWVDAILSVLSSLDVSKIEGVICTDYAEFAKGFLGGQIYGFYDDENTGTETGRHSGGHDFLLVDGRYVVDLWLREVVGWTEQVVFDLEAEQDQDSVARYFGDRQAWSLVSR